MRNFMIQTILDIKERIINGEPIKPAEANSLLAMDDKFIPYLTAAANEVRLHFKGDDVETCALANIKSGGCSEDCKFCSQSAHYESDSPTYNLQSVEEMVTQAKEAEKAGATEFCMVSSGWGQNIDSEFENIVEAVKRISQECKIMVDASLGFLTPEQTKRLKDAGLYRNNHNLEACQSHFDKVVTSHTYMDRVDHVTMVQEYGIHPCSGGILGMGETPEQRLELAFELASINADCVPINILNPRPNTPFEHLEPIRPMDIIKTIALFRLILPKSTIKIAGGREVNLRDLQSMALAAGANGLILGKYLTTMGRSSEQDLQMLKDLNFTTA
ncbi:MAG: biotin synthase [Candidatus Omnitrophota bacterium]|jgi:biotin synthase